MENFNVNDARKLVESNLSESLDKVLEDIQKQAGAGFEFLYPGYYISNMVVNELRKRGFVVEIYEKQDIIRDCTIYWDLPIKYGKL